MRELKFRVWSPIHKAFWPLVLGDEFTFKNSDVICQYTGLHDKNGKEIYEGDIFNAGEAPQGDVDMIGVVSWISVTDGFIHTGWYLHSPWGDHLYPNYLAIIGNIYENPELVSGQPEKVEV
jgi:hypothetical protein